ncbi:MAG: redoxin domain-containing protein [Byssovorax sp.]
MKYPAHSARALTGLLVATSALLGACGSVADPATTGGTTTTTAGSGGAGSTTTSAAQGTGGAGGMAMPPPLMRKTLSGDITWKVTFDDAAKMAGATDCSYTRHYEAKEDTSAPWLCPSCDAEFLADVKMTAGLVDCFPQVSDTPPAATEWIGYSGGKFFRAPGGPLNEQGTATVTATTLTMANTVAPTAAPKGGMLSFDVSGSFTVASEVGDARNGWISPATYACGWPKADPPAYTGDYSLKVGGILPDGLFHDSCGEAVRLHDFKGTYLVVDMSAIDCPPCNSMAAAEEKFIADLAAKNIKANMITLMAPSLSNTTGVTSKKQIDAWVKKYSLTTPILSDRSWGLSTFGVAIPADQLGYPSLAIVRPDLTIMSFESGFGDFATIEMAIEADAAKP